MTYISTINTAYVVSNNNNKNKFNRALNLIKTLKSINNYTYTRRSIYKPLNKKKEKKRTKVIKSKLIHRQYNNM